MTDDDYDDYDDDWTDNLVDEYLPDDTIEDMDNRIDQWYANPLWEGDLIRDLSASGEYVLILELDDGTYESFGSVEELDEALEEWELENT